MYLGYVVCVLYLYGKHVSKIFGFLWPLVYMIWSKIVCVPCPLMWMKRFAIFWNSALAMFIRSFAQNFHLALLKNLARYWLSLCMLGNCHKVFTTHFLRPNAAMAATELQQLKFHFIFSRDFKSLSVFYILELKNEREKERDTLSSPPEMLSHKFWLTSVWETLLFGGLLLPNALLGLIKNDSATKKRGFFQWRDQTSLHQHYQLQGQPETSFFCYLSTPTCFKSTKMTKRTSWTSKKGHWLINMPPLVSWSPPFIFFFWYRICRCLKAVKLRRKVFSSCVNKVHWNFCYIFDCSGKIKQKYAKRFFFFGLDFCEK